jgi:hypothetical protein
VYACFIGEVKLGVGEHITNPQLLGDTQTIQEWSYFHAWIIVVGISFVKISIGFFLLRLVQNKWLKVGIVLLKEITRLMASAVDNCVDNILILVYFGQYGHHVCAGYFFLNLLIPTSPNY